jgi:NADH dehydrogenase
VARPKVVVVGAGFGGLWAARGLANRAVDVTLVDRNNYHTFFPLLYQVAAAELGPTDIAHPVRSIFRGAGNITVRMAAMTGLDMEGRRVLTDQGPLPYDYLVLALGSEASFFGVPGAAEHAYPLRWMDDAVPLRYHVLKCFEAAAATTDHELRRRLLTFAVVGGGPTGVEYAGALSELVFGPLHEDFPGISPEEVSIELLEASDTLLRGMPAKLARYAFDRLARRRVRVRLGSAVQSVDAGGVELPTGRLSTNTVVWTAGIQGDPRAATWGLPVGRGGRVPVTPHLDLDGRPEVFVVGDLAYLEDEKGVALPQVAQVAIQQGRRASANILRLASGRPPEPFRYRDLGMLAVIGRNAAAANVFGLTFTGWVAWWLWLVIHISWLVGFRNRALVLLNWGWNYLFFRRAVRLILPAVWLRRDEVV